MAYDEALVERLREVYEEHPGVVEKKMFGGIAFMVHGHMSCGVTGERLMARVGPEQYESALSHPHAKPMDFTGKPLKGFVYVEPYGFESDSELESRVGMSLNFERSLPPR